MVCCWQEATLSTLVKLLRDVELTTFTLIPTYLYRKYVTVCECCQAIRVRTSTSDCSLATLRRSMAARRELLYAHV